ARDTVLNTPAAGAGPARGPGAIAFHPDGYRLLTNSDLGAVTAWDPLTGLYVSTRTAGPPAGDPSGDSAITAISVSADGRTTAAATADGTVLRWQTRTNWYPQPTDSVTSLAFAPDGATVTAGDTSGRLHTWTVEDGRQLATATSDAGVFGVEFAANGLRAVGTIDARFVLRPAGGGPAAERTISLPDRVYRSGAMALSPDGRWFAEADAGRPLGGASDDVRVRVWDTETLTERAVVEFGSGAISDLSFSVDGTRLVAVSSDDHAADRADRAVLITWRAPEFAEPHRIPLGPATLIEAAFTPDGDTLITAGDSGTIQLRDPDTGTLRAEFGAHPASVRAIAVSPDGRTVATVTTTDSIVRLWSIPDRTLVAQLRGHEGPLNEVEFSPDGARLATGGSDTDVAVWPVTPDEAAAQICANLSDAGEEGLTDLGCPPP
ncbi:MAG: WD40 repeat domain-containing protein, partial [Pseudonocardia sp.]